MKYNFYTAIIILIFTILIVTSESSIGMDKPTIAVLRFENRSTFDRLDPLEVALPYMLISDLSKISSIQLVERDKIDKLIAETELTEKDLMDPATAQRAGKALGANFIVIGSFQEEIKSGMATDDMGESELTVNVLVKDIISGNVIKEIKASGKAKEFFKIEKEMIQELIEFLNVSLSKETRKQVDNISTQSLEAILHFGRGAQFRSMSGYCGIQIHSGRQGAFSGRVSNEEGEKLLQQAVSEFQQAIYLDSDCRDAQYALAVTFGDLAGIPGMQDVKQKEDKYLHDEMSESEKFVSLFPDDPRCVERLVRLGRICFDRGYMSYADRKKQKEYFDKAIQWYRKRISDYSHVQEGIVDVLNNLAFTFRSKGDYINAIQTYEYLIRCYPEEKGQGLYPVKIRAHYHIFDCYKALKRYDKALEIINYIMTAQLFGKPYLDKVFPEMKPEEHRDDMLVLKKLRGDLYFEKGEYQKAIDEWLAMSGEINKLGDSDKKQVEAIGMFEFFQFWFDLAQAYKELNEIDQAIRCLKESIRYASEYEAGKLHDTYLDLGKHYEKQGDYKKALSLYEDCLGLREAQPCQPWMKERILACRQKLGITGKDRMIEWVSLSPLREKEERFVVEPSITGHGYIPSSIATWNSSVWITFGACYKQNPTGKFKHSERPHWYLYCLNLDSMTEKFIDVPDEFQIGSGPMDFGEVPDIAVDDKEIWLSCGKRSVVCYDRLSEKWTHFTKDNGLVFNTSHCVALSPGMVWCGLGEEGRGAIMAYEKGRGKWFFYHHPIATATKITSLALDGDNLWIGNDEGTISILNTKDFSWSILHQDRKGYTSAVEDIFVGNDAVWLACDFNGIRRYDKKTKEWKIWDFRDPNRDPNRGIILRLKGVAVDDSDIWAWGNEGVYKLDTSSNQFSKIEGGRFFNLNTASSIAVCGRFIWFIRDNDIIVHIKEGIAENALKVNKE